MRGHRIATLAVAGLLLQLLAVAGDGSGNAAAEPRPRVVVTTSMMGAAVADVASGWSDPVPLFPATGCPGQFDMTPRALAAVEDAALVLVHDYQESLRRRIAATGKPWRSIPTTGTQALPGPYLDLCAEVARALAAAFPAHAAALQERLNELRRTLPVQAEQHRQRAASAVAGRTYLTASFQVDFVRWAGADPAVTFDRSREMSLRDMDRLVHESRSAHAAGVVGNEPWGDREVRAFSAALGVPWVLLGNYPERVEPGAWLRLVQTNCEALVNLTGDE